MRLHNFEWLWLIVFVVAWLWPMIRKVLSAGDREKPPPVPKAKPKRRPQTRREPVDQAKPFGVRREVTDQIRELVDQLRRGAQPPMPASRAPAPIRETVSAPRPAVAAPPPIRELASVPPLAPKVPLPSPSAIAEPRPTPASVWAEALRDRRALREIIVAAEIIGPPKGA
jgi:hypothetical protein